MCHGDNEKGEKRNNGRMELIRKLPVNIGSWEHKKQTERKNKEEEEENLWKLSSASEISSKE